MINRSRVFHRRPEERGATLVEAAIVTPLAMLMIFGVIWSALLARSILTVDQTARNGARSAAISGSDVTADYDLLQAIKPSLSAFDGGNVNRIVVYQASQLDQPPPPDCIATSAVSSPSSHCNVYTSADLNRPASDFGVAGWSGDDGFPSSSRSTSRSSGTGMYVGVYIHANMDVPVFGLPQLQNVNRFKVLQIEPRTY